MRQADTQMTQVAKKQLLYIQKHSTQLDQNGYDFGRIDVIDGFVTIDGYGLPTVGIDREYKTRIYSPQIDSTCDDDPQFFVSLFEIA